MPAIRSMFAACFLSGFTRASLAVAATSPSGSPPYLAWTAPDGCPAAATVRAAVQAMVGPRISERGSGFAAEGVVTSEPGGIWLLRASVERDGASETKAIEAPTCAELADAYEVIVAFAIDPSARARSGHEPIPSDTSREGKRSHEGEAASAAPRVPGPSAVLAAGPLIATAAGLLPFPALGVGGRVALEAGLRWEIAGTYWPERGSTVTAGGIAVGALVGLAAVQSSVCGSLWNGTAAVCVGADVGAMHATGTSVPTTKTGTSWWLAPTSSVVVRLHLGPRFSLRVRLDVGIPVFRPTFVLDQIGPTGTLEVYTPAQAFGVLSLEPEVILFATDSGGRGHSP